MTSNDRSVVAFFDVDDTLLSTNSAMLFARHLYDQGRVSRSDIALTLINVVLHRLGGFDPLAAMGSAMNRFIGTSIEEMEHECRQWFESTVLDYLSAEGVAAVEAHKAAGHRVILCSASTQFLCEPLVEHLKIDGAICNRVLHRDGRITGRIVEPLCYGLGKRVHLERFAESENIDLARSYFYSDSVSDLPALEAVGNPVAVNPDRTLAREAKLRAWPILRWRESGEWAYLRRKPLTDATDATAAR